MGHANSGLSFAFYLIAVYSVTSGTSFVPNMFSCLCFLEAAPVCHENKQLFHCKHALPPSSHLACRPCQLMPRTCPLLEEKARRACEDRCEEVQRALAKNRTDAKEKKAAARQEARKAMAVWKLSRFVMDVVLILFSLSECTCPCPVEFLGQHGHKKVWPLKADTELVSIVQEAFLQIEVDAYVSLTNMDNSSNPTAMQVALRFRSMYTMHGWVKNLNQGKGIAPPSALVGAKLEELQSKYPAHFRYRNLTVPWQSNYRVAVHRWRRCFGNRYGRIRRRDAMTAETMQTKVWLLI